MRVRSRSLMVALVVVALIGPLLWPSAARARQPRRDPARFLLHRPTHDLTR